ncbi:MAG: hypothetical protein J6A04_00065 [Clostridia bacterium]|nr:hypothetical protein [Clostridia bacterium]
MGIIYLISVIILFVTYLLIQKTKNKIDILKQVALGFVLLFCYNTFICYVLTFFTIPVTLLGLSIINAIFTTIMIVYLVKTKKIQTYQIEKVDILYIILLGIATIIVSYLNFGFPFEIKYETGDPSVHYLTSEMFAEGDGLLAAEKPDQVYGSFAVRKTASYVNSGLIMKCLDGVTDSFDNYIIFILFGIFILFLTAWMFYSTIATFAKNHVTRFLAFVLALLYTMGYPLNSFLFGFEYLSMGILILGAIIACVDIYQKEEIGYKQNLLVFFLLNFGLFTAYYMLVPYTYSALWIYFMIAEYKKQGKIFTRRTILMLVITLLIPFGLGYIYHIAPDIYGSFIKIVSNISNNNNNPIDLSNAMKYSNTLVNKGLSVNGYIYVNLFSNMLLLLPFAIVAMYKGWKENKAVTMMALFDIAFIVLLLIGALFGKVSMYYLSKNYFALWLFLYYLTYKGLIITYEKNKYIPAIFTGIYVAAITISLLFFEANLTLGQVDEEENILQVADIYGVNKLILEKPKDLNTKELELLKYVRDNISEDKTIEIAGDAEQGYWGYVMLRRINDDDEHGGENKLSWKMIFVGERAGKVDYVVYFNRGYFYQYWKDKLWENAEAVYENEAGGILQYKK